MSTKYFILTKTNNVKTPIYNNDSNQIVHLKNSLCYILPYNLLTCYCDRGLFEAGLIEWCKQFCKPDKNILDIGAHTGTYALSLSSSCKKVYCFEPQQMTYYALCGSVALSNIQNIQCLNVGLGSEEQCGKNILKIVSNDGGGSSLHHQPNMSVLREEEIHIEMLDNFGLTDIGFIKMDVEDNEYFVLLGAKETLKLSNYPTIMFECNDFDKNKNLFDYLISLGYEIVRVSGVNNMYLANVVTP